MIKKIFLWIKDRTGFFSYTDLKGDLQRGKTLWDWLGLLVVPVVLAIGAIWFNNSQQTQAEEIARDQVREETLHAYFNEMEDLLLHEDLLTAKDNPTLPALIVAQVKTVTALRSLDQERRDRILQFIRDSGLSDLMLNGASFQKVNVSNSDFSSMHLIYANLREANLTEASLTWADLTDARLSGANLTKASLIDANLTRADLSGANLIEASLWSVRLSGANLTKASLIDANLTRADLSEANLTEANLSRVYLSEANLSEANLSLADLSGANLSQADLTGADLSQADLTGADLSGAKVSDEQLSKAKSLKGAIMPDGSKHK